MFWVGVGGSYSIGDLTTSVTVLPHYHHHDYCYCYYYYHYYIIIITIMINITRLLLYHDYYDYYYIT